MKANQLMDLVKTGKRPVVKIIGLLWDEAWGEEGMMAEVTQVSGPDSDGCVNFTFDYNKFRETNLPLQSHTYYLKGSGTGTAFEAGMMKEDDIQEDVSFQDTDDLPLELIEGGILGEYVQSGSEDSYVKWLEAKLEELVPEAMKTWKQGI